MLPDWFDHLTQHFISALAPNKMPILSTVVAQQHFFLLQHQLGAATSGNIVSLSRETRLRTSTAAEITIGITLYKNC